MQSAGGNTHHLPPLEVVPNFSDISAISCFAISWKYSVQHRCAIPLR